MLPDRQGHFRLESGYHTDRWLSLDALFADPMRVAPLVTALADKLQPHRATAVCGPLVGGALLAEALARTLALDFAYAEPNPGPPRPGLFQAEYRLPTELRRRIRGARVAVVDDVISAGSSVRATIAHLAAAGATTIAVGALLVLGDKAEAYFASERLPLETLGRHELSLWAPAECPLCRAGAPLQDPSA